MPPYDELHRHVLDALHPLQVTLVYRMRGDVVERSATLIHPGPEDAPGVSRPARRTGVRCCCTTVAAPDRTVTWVR